MTQTDPRIDKRRVTMKSIRLSADGSTITEEAVDYVRPDHLDAYVADARTRWQLVEVSDEPDAGVVYPAEGKMAEQLAKSAAKVNKAEACASYGWEPMTPTLDNLDAFLAQHRERFGDAVMVANTSMRNTLADAYAGAATYADLYQTSGASAAGTAISGGSPAYASKALTWNASSGGVKSTTATVFDIPSGATVAGFGVKTGAAGSYLDGGALTSQAFASQGTYTLTITYTQT